LRAHTGISAADSLTIVSVSAAQVSEVVVDLDGERYLIRVERVPSDQCGPGCTANADTYVLRSLIRHEPAGQSAIITNSVLPARLLPRRYRLTWPFVNRCGHRSGGPSGRPRRFPGRPR
jgi:hypothetical protein